MGRVGCAARMPRREEPGAGRVLQAVEHAACLRREEGARALCGDALAGSPSATVQTWRHACRGTPPGSAHIVPTATLGGVHTPPHSRLHCSASDEPLRSLKAVAKVSYYLT